MFDTTLHKEFFELTEFSSQIQVKRVLQENQSLLARCQVAACLVEEPEGLFIELAVSAPEISSVGSITNKDFLKQKTAAACLLNSFAQVRRIIENAGKVNNQLAIDFNFYGNWDETLEPIKKKIAEEAILAYWQDS